MEYWLLATTQEADLPECIEDEKHRLALMLQAKWPQLNGQY